jgi:hypothetical protein
MDRRTAAATAGTIGHLVVLVHLPNLSSVAVYMKLCIVPHMGMGDMIVLNGMVRTMCDRAEACIMVAKRAYASSVESLYGDIKNLRLLLCNECNDVSEIFGSDGETLESIRRAGFDIVRIGYHTGNASWQALDAVWTRALYRQVGVAPELMYARFHVSRHDTAETECAKAFRAAAGGDGGYIIVHDDPSRGLLIDPALLPSGIPVIHVDDARVRRSNIFDYAKAIEGAVAFHGIDSCFMLMIDFLQLEVRRVLHAYAKDQDMSLALYRTPPDMVLRKWMSRKKLVPPGIEFITYNLWQVFADHHIDWPHQTKHLYTPRTDARIVSKGDIIFVKTDILNEFCDTIVPKLTVPCTILTGHSDHTPSARAWDAIHRCPAITTWLAMHLARESPKATCIPIGFTEPDRPHGDQCIIRAAMDVSRKRDETTGKRRSSVLFPATSNTHPIRTELRNVSHIRIVHMHESCSFKDYLDEMSKHAYVICPRGNGIDVHRVYEALAVGTVPIYVSHDDPPGCYATLPIIVVKGGSKQLLNLLDELPDFLPFDRDDTERRVLSASSAAAHVR